MSIGASVSCKQARIGTPLCKTHETEYLERIDDISREIAGSFDRGILLNDGRNLATECNGLIGIRIMREADLRHALLLKGQGSGGDVSAVKNARLQTIPPVVPDSRNAEPGIVIADGRPGPNVAQAGANTPGGVSTTNHVCSNADTKQRTAG